jgi:hypothetical protein
MKNKNNFDSYSRIMSYVSSAPVTTLIISEPLETGKSLTKIEKDVLEITIQTSTKWS